MADGGGKRRLYEIVDRLLDGPPQDDWDGWVVEVLSGLGIHVLEASAALCYEAGRVISGCDRRKGYFPPTFDRANWVGAKLKSKVDPETAAHWMKLGEDALSGGQPVELQQRALAAILQPIARVSHHSWLDDLAVALAALPLGEVRPVLQRSKKKLEPYQQAWSGWTFKLNALSWAEAQIAANKMKRDEAFSLIAREFGLKEESSSVRDWPETTRRYLGELRVEEALNQGRSAGSDFRKLQKKVACGEITEKYARDVASFFEEVWGPDTLKHWGQRFLALPPKRSRNRPKKKKD